jgi:hypothetical protein
MWSAMAKVPSEIIIKFFLLTAGPNPADSGT